MEQRKSVLRPETMPVQGPELRAKSKHVPAAMREAALANRCSPPVFCLRSHQSLYR